MPDNPLNALPDHSADTDWLIDKTGPMVWTFVSMANFDPTLWYLSDGQTIFEVTIQDRAFLAAVGRETVLVPGDLLICRMRMQQTYHSPALHTVYTVITVTEHRPVSPLRHPRRV